MLSLSKAIGASLEDLELNDIERRDKILRRCPAVVSDGTEYIRISVNILDYFSFYFYKYRLYCVGMGQNDQNL